MLFLSLLLFGGCTSRESDAESGTQLFLIDSFEVWHNLMPGGKPALFFTAVVKAEKKFRIDTDSITIVKVVLELGSDEKAVWKGTIQEISVDFPDSVREQWNIYRISSEEGHAEFKDELYEGYTAIVSLSGKFGIHTVKRTGITIDKVY